MVLFGNILPPRRKPFRGADALKRDMNGTLTERKARRTPLPASA